jgi:Amt family ammonium transporter
MIKMQAGMDVFFLLIGAAMVLAMHAGFAFLEAGTVRRKNQVNALSKILCDLGVSTIAYFAVGYAVAYGVTFLAPAPVLTGTEGEGFGAQGIDLVRFFFLLMFAAAIPAIISGGIAERARFMPQLIHRRAPAHLGLPPAILQRASTASKLSLYQRRTCRLTCLT